MKRWISILKFLWAWTYSDSMTKLEQYVNNIPLLIFTTIIHISIIMVKVTESYL